MPMNDIYLAGSYRTQNKFPKILELQSRIIFNRLRGLCHMRQFKWIYRGINWPSEAYDRREGPYCVHTDPSVCMA